MKVPDLRNIGDTVDGLSTVGKLELALALARSDRPIDRCAAARVADIAASELRLADQEQERKALVERAAGRGGAT